MDFNQYSAKELLQLQASIIIELKERKVVRTKNNPLGDYTEWLVAKSLDLTLANNSATSYDATDKNGIKYQIKARRVTPENKSRQLSAIRKYEDKGFDFIAAVIFDENFDILDAYLIPHNVVGEYATYKAHPNAHNLHLKGAILKDNRLTNIKIHMIKTS